MPSLPLPPSHAPRVVMTLPGGALCRPRRVDPAALQRLVRLGTAAAPPGDYPGSAVARRARAAAEWRRLEREGLSWRAVQAFHGRYKYLLMAHDPARYRTLGRYLSEAAREPVARAAPHYIDELLTGLSQMATRGSHANVLQHLSGYLKRQLTAAEKAAMRVAIEQYQRGEAVLDVPKSLLRCHFERHPHPYIARQAYLEPACS